METNTEIRKKSIWSDKWLLLALFFVSLGIIFIFFPWNVLNGKGFSGFILKIEDYDKLGAFISGISTPLFAAATIIFLARTYFLQREELEEQRAASAKTYSLQKEEIEEQRKAIQEERIRSQKQQFDNTFFNLLENHQHLVEAMNITARGTTYSKRECFKHMYLDLANKYNGANENYKLEIRSESENLPIERVIILYGEVQGNFKSDLHHYFRFLYRILKFIKESKVIDDNEKYEYASLLRAVLSPYELLMLFYNCLHPFGIEKFKFLLEEFSFLKNLSSSDLLDENGHKPLYNDLAYADSEERPEMLTIWRAEREQQRQS